MPDQQDSCTRDIVVIGRWRDGRSPLTCDSALNMIEDQGLSETCSTTTAKA